MKPICNKRAFGQSGGGPPQSKTLRVCGAGAIRASVLDCANPPARILHRPSCSADFQVCCIAGFQTCERPGGSMPCRFGNRRPPNVGLAIRLGNLRYLGFARAHRGGYEIFGLALFPRASESKSV